MPRDLAPDDLPDLHSRTRRVEMTHDGKPIGHTEPLDPDNPFRGLRRRAAAYRKMMQTREQNAAGGRKSGGIRGAQQRSMTRRGAPA